MLGSLLAIWHNAAVNRLVESILLLNLLLRISVVVWETFAVMHDCTLFLFFATFLQRPVAPPHRTHLTPNFVQAQ